MADYPYTTVPGKIKPLITKIREVGVPTRVTAQWLKTIGFTSSNDASPIGILKYIGFTDTSGVPTPKWSQHRGANARKVLGDALREGYADLFAVYPDANQRSQSDLENVFSTSSTSGKQVINKTVSTCKFLAEQADFSPVGDRTDLHMSTGPLHTPVVTSPSAEAVRASGGPALHIDVQIHISPEASIEQIDQIFSSMAKHLYGPQKTS
jgi:hypothetical protein